MKRFFKPKLIFPLVAVVLLVIAVSLASDPLGNSHAAPPRKPLFIFLPGINTHLTAAGVRESRNGNFDNPDASLTGNFSPTLETILGIRGFVNSRAIFYSYTGSTATGIPQPYSCVDTFRNSLLTDIKRLNTQIGNAVRANPNTDIYLIGHSLGGVVAFGYLALLEAPNVFHASFPQETTLPAGAHLKAVITLDSPIGGVRDSNYLTDARFIFTTSRFGLVGPNTAFCPGLKSNQFESPTELTDVFKSTSKTTPPEDGGTDPQGAQASLLTLKGVKLPSVPSVSCATITQTSIPSNECLAEDAQADLGTSVLSIGNKNDFLWNPSTCSATINRVMHKHLPTNIPDFIKTQWLEDEGSAEPGIYGRSFAAGFTSCGVRALLNKLNHLEVLTNGAVQTGIRKFLKPITGGAFGGIPSILTAQPALDFD